MEDLRGAFGERIRHLREERGWSQETLAEKAGLHFTYVSQIERGTRNPGLTVVARLADALGQTLPSLVSDLPRTSPRRSPRRVGRPRRSTRSH